MGQLSTCPCGGKERGTSREQDPFAAEPADKLLNLEEALGLWRWHLAQWPPLLPRHVRPLPGLPEPKSSTLRILSFNLLADGKQGQEQWECTPPDALVWDFRKWRLLEEMAVHLPDVLLLQEVDAEFFDEFFVANLSQIGYSGRLRQMPESRPDGVAILWKRSRLRLLRCDEMEFSAAREVAIIALLETVLDCPEPLHAQARQIAVTSTHLNSGKDPASESVRASQVMELLAHVSVIASGVPVVLGADFNAEPGTAAKTGPALALPAALGHELQLGTAYANPRYTTWKKRPKGEVCRVIDYILFTEKLLKLVALLNLPEPEEMPPERLPTYAYPSDHLALMAVFQFL